MEKDHFRAPVSNTFRRKTPFTQLYDHMTLVKKGIDILGEGLINYYKGDYKGFSALSKKMSAYEHEADVIKTNLRNHLPTSLFMPVDKGKFLRAVREQDAILDHADNLVRMLHLRHTKIPDKLQKKFIDHVKSMQKTVEAMEKAVENIMDLVAVSYTHLRAHET